MPTVKPTEPIPERKKAGFIFGTNTDAQPKDNPPNEVKNVKDSLPTKIVDDNRSNRICKHCNKDFIYKHHKQIYCSDECRAEAWEKKTGKEFIKKRKS